MIQVRPHYKMICDRSGLPQFLLMLVVLLAISSIPSSAQVPDGGALNALILPRDSRIAHYSSYDRQGRNADFLEIAPGETLTLVDHEGAGIVRRWWITIQPRNHIEIQRKLIVRCYWDGEEEPSVEVPVSDFFGMGFGEWRDYISLPLNMTSGGYNSYWAMPFRRDARITVENTAETHIERFYFNIDIEAVPDLPEDVLYFHAQFRRTTSETGVPVTILETSGRGHYVGTLLSMQPRRGSHLGYLEGNERVFIDDEEEPSIIGTGTEDYFSSGWYYDTGVYSAPQHGATIKDDTLGRINTYRWHIDDPIPFTRSIRFDMEHGGTNDMPDVDYSSVAFWYQTHPHPPFPPLPDDLMPVEPPPVPRIEGMIEAETLIDEALATHGEVQEQYMMGFEGEWSGGRQLWWVNGEPGALMRLPLQVASAGRYEFIGYFTRAQDYGNIQLSINGEPLMPRVEGYGPTVAPTGPVSFGEVVLHEGENALEVEITGKDSRSDGFGDGYLVGIDGFRLIRTDEP